MIHCKKRGYLSKNEAKRSMKRAQSHRSCSVRRVYKCPRCGWWHQTSMKKS